MTALSQYDRLECSGIWRENADAQRRDVIVFFGDASLVLVDSNERPLAHWSLAAIERMNAGERPALFSPDPTSGEVLEIEDDTMIAAIAKVMSAVRRRTPQRGRLRTVLLGSSLALVVGLAVFWMPGAMRHHTAGVVPTSMRVDVGEKLLSGISRVSGAPCRTTEGVRVLDKLSKSLLGSSGRLVVLPGGIVDTAHLPGGLVLLNRSVVEDHEDPAVAAGYILAERARLRGTDPLENLLDELGTLTTFRLLTTGTLPTEGLDAYAELLMTTRPVPLAPEIILKEFEAAQVASSPYAYARDVSGESVLPLIEGDPMRGQIAAPILSDGDWVRLQGICGG